MARYKVPLVRQYGVPDKSVEVDAVNMHIAARAVMARNPGWTAVHDQIVEVPPAPEPSPADDLPVEALPPQGEGDFEPEPDALPPPVSHAHGQAPVV